MAISWLQDCSLMGMWSGDCEHRPLKYYRSTYALFLCVRQVLLGLTAQVGQCLYGGRGGVRPVREYLSA